MPKRKTIDVEAVRCMANAFLEGSSKEQVGERLGVASLVEQVLQATDNYKGFGYQQHQDAPDFDGSRRYYYK